MAKSDFTGYLIDHINQLQAGYFMDWWKYDQEYMGKNEEQGDIKNILAFQDALKTVRQQHPELYIENCMSGGRMINDLTNTLAQIHWIKDGGDNGLDHARENIRTALGASHIIPLSKVERWTNRVNEIHDSELLKYYCRSAMIGVWGVSADMHKLTAEQKSIMLNEIEHYRKLNSLKSYNIYRILYPEVNKFAGIIYYNATLDEAAALIFRWKHKGELRYNIPLRLLRDKSEYTVNVWDTSKIIRYKGTILQNDGLPVDLGEDEMSAIYYIE
jgi:alpha-galactosidase